MKAIICPSYGPAEVLRMTERERPGPRDDEVLIRIRATAVTNSDIFIRGSNIPWRYRIPMRLMMGITRPRKEIIGEVLAGEIVQAGPKITRFKPGDQVYGLTGFSLGAYAEYKCMKDIDSKQGCIARKPANISFEEATSAAYGGLLAFQCMEKAKILSGQKVLIYGASGTTGTIAVQYAKHLGAEVSAVCGPANLDFVRSLGAEKVLDYTDAGSVCLLEAYELVIDAVGRERGSALKKAGMRALTPNGKNVSIDDGALLLESNRLDRITALVEAGAIRPINDRVFSFEQMVEAHKFVEGGHKRGGVAVTVA
jgi:NADPH:quinone reductase-like Zn-dependent oxidoreductase